MPHRQPRCIRRVRKLFSGKLSDHRRYREADLIAVVLGAWLKVAKVNQRIEFIGTERDWIDREARTLARLVLRLSTALPPVLAVVVQHRIKILPPRCRVSPS